MESLYLLIPIALVFCVLAIKLLLWAIDSGQYDDLDREGWRILQDEDDKAGSRKAPGSGTSREDESGEAKEQP